MSETRRLRVAVFGASGYVGGELVRLLAEHPNVELVYLAANESASRELTEVHPHLAASPIGGWVLAPLDAASAADRASFAFPSLPHGASAFLAPALLEAGLQVVDLAGDFRLPAAAYPEWYGFEHPAPAWLEKSVYGLPEVFGEEISGASLVANPGSYPTPVVLGLAPLRAAGLIGSGPIGVDGKAGCPARAGRSPTPPRTRRPRRAFVPIASLCTSTRPRWSGPLSSPPASPPRCRSSRISSPLCGGYS
jgi:N-acetyl-gamma-glutamyl-phosphate reductase